MAIIWNRYERRDISDRTLVDYDYVQDLTNRLSMNDKFQEVGTAIDSITFFNIKRLLNLSGFVNSTQI